MTACASKWCPWGEKLLPLNRDMVSVAVKQFCKDLAHVLPLLCGNGLVADMKCCCYEKFNRLLLNDFLLFSLILLLLICCQN